MPYVVLIAVLLLVGFYPSIVMDLIDSGVVPLIHKINGVPLG